MNLIKNSRNGLMRAAVILAVVLWFALDSTVGVHSATLTFNYDNPTFDPGGSGGTGGYLSEINPNLRESGFHVEDWHPNIDGSGYNGISGGNINNVSDNVIVGRNSDIFYSGGITGFASGLFIRAEDGAAFDLERLDFKWLRGDLLISTSFEVTNPDYVSQFVRFDGLSYSGDFQTIEFGNQFQGVSGVWIAGANVQLNTNFRVDNVVVSPSVGAGESIAPSILPLGDVFGEGGLAYGVSETGNTVVGTGNSVTGGTEGFIWNSVGGFAGIGDLGGYTHASFANRISDNGKTVVGWSPGATSNQAVTWTEANGLTQVFSGEQAIRNSNAKDVSADGSVIVGSLGNSSFIWRSGVVQDLGDLEGGIASSRAEGVSSDGSVVVGQGNSASGPEAFRWTDAQGMVGLGDLPGGAFRSEAKAISSDGAVVVGYGTSDTGQQAFRWSLGEGMLGLGDLSGGASGLTYSRALSCSGDGGVVVGTSGASGGDVAFIWTSEFGMRNLKDYLIESGVDMSQWWLLESATDISPNGRFITGYGFYTVGNNLGSTPFLVDLGTNGSDGPQMVQACGIDTVTEGFETGSWSENFYLGDNPGGAAVDYGGAFSIISGTGSRVYLATVDSDFSSKDFKFKAEVTIPSTSFWSYPFFGMGNPTPSPSKYFEPSVPNLLMVSSTDHFAVRDDTIGGGGVIDFGQHYGSLVGTHGMEMSWDADAGIAVFKFDFGNDGTMDQSFELDGSDNGFDASNARLIVGGGNGVRFDNLEIISSASPPLVNCKDITVPLNAVGMASISAEDLIADGISLCEDSTVSMDVDHFDCSNLGPNNVELTVVDVLGRTASCGAVVTVVDDLPPVVVVQDLVVKVTEFGQTTIEPSLIDAGSSDNCGIGSLSLSQTEFGCADLGDNLVVLTVEDLHGNQSTATALVSVELEKVIIEDFEDHSPEPEFLLGANPGDATVDFQDDFTITSGAGARVYMRTLRTDFSQTDFVFSADVTIPSTSPWAYPFFGMGNPEPFLGHYQEPNVPNLLLVPSGNHLSARDNTFNGGGIINYGQGYATLLGTHGLEMKWNAATGLAEFSFDFQNDGTVDQSFTLNGGDNGFNDANSTLIMGGGYGVSFDNIEIRSISEVMAPEAKCRDMTVVLGPDGTAVITPEDIDNGSVVGCGSVSLSIDVTSFDCDDVGVNPVMLTVTDAAGNSASCVAHVTVVDDFPPVAVAQDVVVELDAFGQAVIHPTDIGAGSSDLCGIGSMSLSQTEFGCADVGDNLVVLSVVDSSGNVAVGTATVTVVDSSGPVLNEAISLFRDDFESYPVDSWIGHQGGWTPRFSANNQEEWRVVDAYSVSPSQGLQVFGINSTAGEINRSVVVPADAEIVRYQASIRAGGLAGRGIHKSDVFLRLGNSGNANLNQTGTLEIRLGKPNQWWNLDGIYGFVWDGGYVGDSVEMRSGYERSIETWWQVAVEVDLVTQRAAFFLDGQQIGDVPLGIAWSPGVWYVNVGSGDGKGWVDDVEILSSKGAIIPESVVVELDAAGSGSLDARDFLGGFSDACGVDSVSLDQSTFGCIDLGEGTVVVSAVDVNGNVTEVPLTVVVTDPLPPVVRTRDVVVELDADGFASIAPSDLDAGSDDNCGIASMSLDVQSFDCSNLGANLVEMTVADSSGNVAVGTSTVTVVDSSGPVLNEANLLFRDDFESYSVDSWIGHQGGWTPRFSANNQEEWRVVDEYSTSPSQGLQVFGINSTAGEINRSVVVPADAEIVRYQASIRAGGLAGRGIHKSDVFLRLGNSGTANLNQTGTLEIRLGKPNQWWDLDGIHGFVWDGGYVGDSVEMRSGYDRSIETWWQVAVEVDLVTQRAAFFLDGQQIGDVPLGIAWSPGIWYVNVGSGDGKGWVDDVEIVSSKGAIIPESVVVELDAAGSGSLDAGDFLGAFSDACGIDSVSLNQSTFGCIDIGEGTIVVSAADVNGNVTEVPLAVVVTDDHPPVVQTGPVTLYLDRFGNGTLSPEAVNHGSSDNCGIGSMSLSQTTFDCADVGENLVTLTVVDVNGNTASETAVVTVVDDIDPLVVTRNKTVWLDEQGVVVVDADVINDGSIDNCGIASMQLDRDTFGCADVGENSITLTVTDVNGNSASKDAILTVLDAIDPQLVCPAPMLVSSDPGSCGTIVNFEQPKATDNCSIASVVFEPASGSFFDLGKTRVRCIVTDPSGNQSQCQFDVTVVDEEAPVVRVQDMVVSLDANGVATIQPEDIDAGSSDNCGITSMSLDKTQFDCSDVGVVPVVLTVTDESGNVSTEALAVTVQLGYDQLADAPADELTGDNAVDMVGIHDGYRFPSDGIVDGITIRNDSDHTQENVTLLVLRPEGNDSFRILDMVDMGMDDLVPASTGANFYELDTPIQVEAGDTFGHWGTGTSGAVPLNNIFNTPSDDTYGQSRWSQTGTLIDVADMAVGNAITATRSHAPQYRDYFINVSFTPTTQARVTVVDDHPPVVQTGPVTLSLDRSGNATLSPEVVNNGSSDNCDIASMQLDQTAFGCANVGENLVTLTVVDVNGNTASETAVVTVVDDIDPLVVTRNKTVWLDEQGVVVVDADVINDGSIDNCGIASMQLDRDTFGCADVGENSITLTVTDVNGNSASKDAILVVLDAIDPQLVCPAPMLVSSDPGSCGTIVNFEQPEATDNCSIASVVFEPASGSFFELGKTRVRCIVTDPSGNQSQCQFDVTVIDDEAPVVRVQDMVVSLDANGVATIQPEDIDAGSNDNCGIASMSLDKTQFDCSDVGGVPVVLTVTDESGNVSTEALAVTVQYGYEQLADASADELTGDNAVDMVGIHDGYRFPSDGIVDGITIRNDSDHTQENVTLLILRPEANDAFRIIEMIDMGMDDLAPESTGTSFYELDTPIQVEAGDTFGHWGPGTSGAVPLNNIFNTASDDTYGQSRWSQTGTLIDVADMTVGNAITVTRSRAPMYRDYFINVSFTPRTQAQVMVVDDLPPVVHTVPVTLSLDRFGNATLSPEMVNHGSSDNCDIASMQLDQTAFGCANVGENLVTLTVVDVNGNTAAETAVVTVVDDIDPFVVTRNITVSLNEQGVVIVEPGAIDDGSIDNCGIASIYLNKTEFGCSDVGAQEVILTVTDVNGNQASQTALVNVFDVTPPSIVCPGDLLVECDGLGNQAEIAAWLNSVTASDACGVQSIVNDYDGLSGGCGPNSSVMVTFVATDIHGNASSCQARVTIGDSVAPSIDVAAADLVVECDGNGNIGELNAWLDSHGGAIASDVCGSVTWTHDFDVLSDDCGQTGFVLVNFVATDDCGNASNTSAVFTIVDTTPAVVFSNDLRDLFPKEVPISFTMEASDACGEVTVQITHVTRHKVKKNGKIIFLDEKSASKSESEGKSGSKSKDLPAIVIDGDKFTLNDSGGVGTIITVYATATDECGNTTDSVFTVNVLKPGKSNSKSVRSDSSQGEEIEDDGDSFSRSNSKGGSSSSSDKGSSTKKSKKRNKGESN